MNWTATKNTIEKNAAGDVEVSVTYSDGNVNVNEMLRTAAPQGIDQMIKNRVAQLQLIDDYVATAQTGEVDLSTPIVEEARQTDEVVLPDYPSKRQELIALKQDLDLGLVEQDVYDTALTELKRLKASE